MYFDKAREDHISTAFRALGMLESLLEWDLIPAHHVPQAREIISAAAEAWSRRIGAIETQPAPPVKQKICTCDGYSFPHREGGGRCKGMQEPDDPRWVHARSKHEEDC